MLNKKTLKNLYSDIRNQLFYMIPEKWKSVYLYASVIQEKNNIETGEMFFYYYPKSVLKKIPINVYEIPEKFNINENEYMKLATKLYDLIKQLRHECIKLDNIRWSNITISIEDVDFLVEYNCDELKNSIYNNDERRIIWKYKHLDYPIEKLSKQERKVLERYLEEESWGQHGSTIYSETFYQEHIHNVIKYDKEPEKDEYIQEKKENLIQEVDLSKVKSQILKINK